MKWLLTILTLITLADCNRKAYVFTSFHEPATEGLRMLWSRDARNWTDLDTILLKPAVGQQKVMRDPSIAQGADGRFHLVWTSSWRGDKGFGYACSLDLVHWTDQRFIPVMENESSVVNVWAPELFYDKTRDEFDIIWASTIPGRFERGQEEDSNNHRMYITRTRDFKAFTSAELFLDPGFSVIDAVIVPRSREEYVLVLKDNTRPNRNLKIATGTSPHGPFANISEPFTENFTEGPSVVKRGNKWLIYFDAYRTKTYEAVETRDFIHFKKAKVSVPAGHKHGTILTITQQQLQQLLKEVKK